MLAHEIAHITNEDLRVMRLADSVSRLTSLLALMGQIAILLNLPALLVGAAEVYWPGLLLLAASPQLALLAQLGLSRVREFDADRLAAELTGDPQGWRPRWRKSSGSAALACWLWPGWGNPPCLRTHPATQERIARLLTLAHGPASALPFHAPHFLPESAVTRAAALAPERAVALIAYQQETSHGLPRPVPRPAPDPFIRRWLFITACIATLMLLWRFLPAIEAGSVRARRRSHRDGAWRSGGGRKPPSNCSKNRALRWSTSPPRSWCATSGLAMSFPCRAAPVRALSGTMPATSSPTSVIRGASEATVKLADGRDYRAALVGTSPAHDIAVLKIGVGFKRPPAVPVGTSADLKVGQKVFAIGNPFGWTGRSPPASSPRSTARYPEKRAARPSIT